MRRVDGESRTVSTRGYFFPTKDVDVLLTSCLPLGTTSFKYRSSRGELLEGVMASVEPIIVVLGPWCSGTSAVAGVLRHLGVFMGAEFDWALRDPHDIWEDYRLSQLCRRAFSEPAGVLQMGAGPFEAKLRIWADEHRRAARIAGSRPGAKNPLLCLAVDSIRNAWGPVIPVVVERPIGKVVASLNRLGWWRDEQERIGSTEHLVVARDLALGDAATVRVDFEALRATPAVVIRRLADELRIEVTEAQIELAVRSIVRPADMRLRASNVEEHHGRDLLLAKVEQNPEDAHSIFFLAQAYFFLGDFVNARKWYGRRAEMGGWDQEIYVAMLRVAESMAQLGAPWPEVQDAYLQAWEFRQTRAEPVYLIARHYREERRYHLGYLFAKRAAEVPFPEEDIMLVRSDVYAWRAADELAVCASWIGKQAEAFTLCRRLLARPDLPDEERSRITGNRDVCVPTMLDAAVVYPDALVQNLVGGARDGDVVVSLIAGADLDAIEHTLNSFVRCCLDVSRVGRFLVVDAGLSTGDRALLVQRYGFLDFAPPGPTEGPGAHLAHLRNHIDARFWLHLGEGWRFFAPENLITRLTSVLEAEPQVFQVGINFTDAVKLTGASAPETAVRRTPEAGRYLLTDAIANGPAMFDTTRLQHAGDTHSTHPDPLAELERQAPTTELHTATLDEILCITAV